MPRICLAGLLTLLLSGAPAAAAGAPAGDPSALPGTSCRVTLFNDSLHAGIGIVATLFGYDKMDGNDVGYTHGLELAVERLSKNGVTGAWALGSRLFTNRGVDPEAGDSHRDRTIWFTEEESLSYIADTRRRRGRTFVEYGGGVIYDSKTFTTIGASGQQDWFHKSFDQKTYSYEDDGRAAWGVFVHGGYGFQRQWPLDGSGTAVAAHARIAVEPHTLTAASRLLIGGAVALSRATSAMKVSATIAAEAVLHPEGVGYNPSVELAYERKGWGIRSSVTFPIGELQNYVHYNEDDDPISTISIFIRFAE